MDDPGCEVADGRLVVSKVVLTCCGVIGFILTGACRAHHVPVDTPIRAVLDVPQFGRVLVPGFLAGGTPDVDANTETVRLVRSELRSKTALKVINNDIVGLAESSFRNASFWKRLGDEYDSPLILTGTVLFATKPRGWSLKATFVFIDGRTGSIMHSADFSEQLSHGRKHRTSALASYFVLMERVLPEVLRIVSDQSGRSSRVLLK